MRNFHPNQSAPAQRTPAAFQLARPSLDPELTQWAGSELQRRAVGRNKEAAVFAVEHELSRRRFTT